MRFRGMFRIGAVIAIAVCILAALPTVAFALDPRRAITQYGHDVWQSDNGLPQNTVQAILQTSDGYIWLGTQEGLVRFDGVRFTIFDNGNTEAIKSNFIWTLFEDSQ